MAHAQLTRSLQCYWTRSQAKLAFDVVSPSVLLEDYFAQHGSVADHHEKSVSLTPLGNTIYKVSDMSMPVTTTYAIVGLNSVAMIIERGGGGRAR